MKESKESYEVFLKVCETGSFSKTAEALSYTQPAISQMMASLEEELGVPLFVRIQRGVQLTDNGKRLYPYIQEVADKNRRLRQEAFAINHKVSGKLRIGSFASVTTLWMPKIIRYFAEHYPDVTIEIIDGSYSELREWIFHGRIDCGFISASATNDLIFYPLHDDPLYAALPIGHPLAQKEAISLPELFQYPLIIETPGCDNDLREIISNCRVKPRIAYSFREAKIILSFVRNGLGVTISKEMVLDGLTDGLVIRPLSPEQHRTIGLAFAKTASSLVSQTLLQYLQESL